MGREIASHSINHLGGYTRKESQLSFSGAIKKTITYHRKAATDKEKVITENFEYDHQDRLLKHWHQVGSEPVELLADNTYNEISQLTNKKVGNNLQSIDYAYNIRGFRSKINDPENLGGKLFGYHIKYEKPETNLYLAKFNGNISEIDWKTAEDGTFRRYNYVYDGLDRLRVATYTEPNVTSPYNNAYTESLAYDLEGNILNLTRNTYIPGQGVRPMDNLTYKYASKKLLSVTDNSGVYDGYPDSSGIQLTYDLNGNMTSHQDKGITSIRYNELNLPNRITFDQSFLSHDMTSSYKNYTQYVYRADGIKVRKEYVYGSGPSNIETHKVTDYLDGFQYTGDILDFIPTSEGYYNFEQKKYIYNYTDQVGNVRLSFYKGANGAAEIDRVTNYYPFGLEFNENIVPVNSITKNYRYSTQGHEKQEDTKWSSFKWRNYDPSFARFFNVDPLAEKYPTWSTYAFSGNRVVDARELEGLEPYVLFKTRERAAANFGQQYNGKSIINKREYAALIYSIKVDGKGYYAYNKPVQGESHGVPEGVSYKAPRGSKAVGWIHSHGNDDYGSAGNYNDQHFSSDDKGYSKALKLDGFLVTPEGSLKQYNLNSDTEKTLRTDMPSDPNNETPRKNTIDPILDPTPSLGDYRPKPKPFPNFVPIPNNPTKPTLDGGLKSIEDKKRREELKPIINGYKDY